MQDAAGYPEDAAALQASPLLNSWWYYSVELLPGMIAQGVYPDSMPLLPRLMLRRCDLRGAACLDVGSMEGLMSALMARGGASRVLAVDGVDHCLEKMEAVRHYHRVEFDYRTVGPMYGLAEKLDWEGFDLINCSGLLYHVVSPLTVLTGLRPALKRNGLMIVSTNVVVDGEAFADFNTAGRLQAEPNTFWYLSTGLLDYALRYLKLAPIATAFLPHEAMATDWRMRTEKDSGYLSVLCRAVDEVLPTDEDEWMADSAARSWEYEWLVDWERAASQPISKIGAKGLGTPRADLGIGRRDRMLRKAPAVIDVTAEVRTQAPLVAAATSDSHLLRLADRS
jgi:SAM-dependent methyltransferase